MHYYHDSFSPNVCFFRLDRKQVWGHQTQYMTSSSEPLWFAQVGFLIRSYDVTIFTVCCWDSAESFYLILDQMRTLEIYFKSFKMQYPQHRAVSGLSMSPEGSKFFIRMLNDNYDPFIFIFFIITVFTSFNFCSISYHFAICRSSNNI